MRAAIGCEGDTSAFAVKTGHDEGIRANAVTPGLILTEAVKINTTEAEREQLRKRIASTRLGTGDDIAALVAFLLADEAEWINGQAISIDGGSVMMGG